MSEAQKDFESVSISLKRLREENVALQSANEITNAELQFALDKVAELSERLKEAIEVIAFYADQESWSKGMFGLPGCVTNQEDHELINFEGEKITCGGKIARAYLSKTPKNGG